MKKDLKITKVLQSNPKIIGSIQPDEVNEAIAVILATCTETRRDAIRNLPASPIGAYFGNCVPRISFDKNGKLYIMRNSFLTNTEPERVSVEILTLAFLEKLKNHGMNGDEIEFACVWQYISPIYPEQEFEYWHYDQPFAFVQFGPTPFEFVSGDIIVSDLVINHNGEDPKIHETTSNAIELGQVNSHSTQEGEVVLCSGTDIHRKARTTVEGFRITIRAGLNH